MFSLRTDREQHVPDSSNHSLYLIKLFSFSNLEGNFGGNQLPDGSICLSLLLLLSSLLLHHNNTQHTTHRDRHRNTGTETDTETNPKFYERFARQTLSLKRAFDLPQWFHVFLQTSLKIKNYMLSWIVKDTTTFEMELCGCKQATAHAHGQPHGVWLNFEHTKKFESFKKKSATTKIEFESAK